MTADFLHQSAMSCCFALVVRKKVTVDDFRNCLHCHRKHLRLYSFVEASEAFGIAR